MYNVTYHTRIPILGNWNHVSSFLLVNCNWVFYERENYSFVRGRDGRYNYRYIKPASTPTEPLLHNLCPPPEFYEPTQEHNRDAHIFAPLPSTAKHNDLPRVP